VRNLKDERYLVEMRGITKRFGKVEALKKVDFNVNYGEIIGLVGDNGAGKSTLIKILVGLFPPDEGEIYFEGRQVRFKSPQESRSLGIEVVYQDLALVDSLSIARNFFLGTEPLRKIGPLKFLDEKRMNKEVEAVVRNVGITLRSPSEFVSILSGGERQAIVIGKAIHFSKKLLVLDEPTANLSVKEATKVLDLIKELRERNISVIFITHNIYHVYPVADRFVILDKGIKIGEVYKKDVTPEDIIEIIKRGFIKKL
jgi:simple sugar transport system ATP-binding protein